MDGWFHEVKAGTAICGYYWRRNEGGSSIELALADRDKMKSHSSPGEFRTEAIARSDSDAIQGENPLLPRPGSHDVIPMRGSSTYHTKRVLNWQQAAPWEETNAHAMQPIVYPKIDRRVLEGQII